MPAYACAQQHQSVCRRTHPACAANHHHARTPLPPGLQELAQTVHAMVAEEPPAAAAAVVAEVKARKEEWGLEDADVAKVGLPSGLSGASRGRLALLGQAALGHPPPGIGLLQHEQEPGSLPSLLPSPPSPHTAQNVFAGLVGAVMSSIGSKNTQQVQFSVLKTLKTYAKVLGAFCTSARLEAALLNTIQVGAGGVRVWHQSQCSRCGPARAVRSGAGRAGGQARVLALLLGAACCSEPHAPLALRHTRPPPAPGDVLRGLAPAEAVCRRGEDSVRRRRAGGGHDPFLVRSPFQPPTQPRAGRWGGHLVPSLRRGTVGFKRGEAVLMGTVLEGPWGACINAGAQPSHERSPSRPRRRRRYTKGSSPKGRNVFLKNMEPFMKW